MQRAKATRDQLKRYNQQLILRTIYQEETVSRAALAGETGLAKPTVSDIVSELMGQGYILEVGHGHSTASGGKRPVLLQFVPTARQVIGLVIGDETITGCLANLDGRIVAMHYLPLEADEAAWANRLEGVINALIAQQDAPILCMGLGVPGVIETQPGSPHRVLREQIRQRYGLPVYLNNNTELAARATVAFGTEDRGENLVVVLVTQHVEIGIALGGRIFHHGGEAGTLRLPSGDPLAQTLTTSALRGRLFDLDLTSLGWDDDPADRTFLHLRYAIHCAQPGALDLLDAIARDLAYVYTWIIGLVRPDEIALAGALVEMGPTLPQRIRHHLQHTISAQALDGLRLTLAEARHLSLRGAVAHALHTELGIV